MIVMTVTMTIPIFMVREVISDRARYSADAISEVSSLWGGKVHLGGPVLVIPVTRKVQITLKDEDGTETQKTQTQAAEPLIILPEEADITADVTGQIRKRGIFEVPVYSATIALDATFEPDFRSRLRSNETPLLAEAELVFLMPGRRSFFGETTVVINGQPANFEPGVPLPELSGVRIPVRLVPGDLKVSASFGLNGAQTLTFRPLARNTAVTVRSDWPDPSFIGSFLPERREISEQGFVAAWRVPHIATNIPVTSRSVGALRHHGAHSAIGVAFIQTLDFYQMVERAVKYGFLFVGLTFLTLFLLETLSKRAVHPAQFILVGLAEAIFFLLLLAFAEQIGFGAAYLVAASATVGLLTYYGLAALQLGRRIWMLTLTLALLYGVLFFLLRSTDLALLVGSVICFAALAVTMVVTRNESWSRAKDSHT